MIRAFHFPPRSGPARFFHYFVNRISAGLRAIPMPTRGFVAAGNSSSAVSLSPLGRPPHLPGAGLFFLAAVSFLLVIAAASAGAQTVAGGQPFTVAQAEQAGAAVQPQAPLSEASAEQARAQRGGDYGTMERPGMGGGQIQSAFDTSRPSDGVYEARQSRACVHKIRTREFMISTVILPEGTEIAAVDLGDPAGFQAEIRSSNVIAVRPNGYGMDTSMTAHAGGGRVFAFYVRAEGHNSNNIPDLVAMIHGTGLPAGKAGKRAGDGAEPAAAPGAPSTGGFGASGEGTMVSRETGEDEDFVERVEFDPATLHGWGDYRLWGSDELRPEAVFRDKRFTYLRYGEKWDGLDLPVAYVVVDGIDELVNTRVQGRTYIIESTAKLIALKSGLRHLCVEYAPKGSRSGPRNPFRASLEPSDLEPWDRRRGL